MRTSNWTALSALALALTVTACGDNGGSDETTNMTTTVPDGTTTTPDPTTGEDPSTTMVDPSTTMVDPSTTTGPDPSTTDPDPSTTTTGGAYTCADYCTIFLDACADFPVYDNDAACIEQCEQWPEGVEGAVDGDSLGCRYYHVTVASMTDPMIHCPHASPNGDLTCVDPAAPTCAAYCTEYFKNCTDDNNVYVDEADCLDKCEPWYQGSMADVVGDTVGCRLYHAGAALSDAPTHCPHASPSGGGVCVP